MFATCLFCHSHLGRNDVVEHFPLGQRLAFDSARGRLWVVCPTCRRWNLSPLEERWEAIEECERLFRRTRARVSTDNIGLAPLHGGVDLVRIGRPLRPEFAAWRYGSQLQWRRRRATVVAGVGAVAAAAAAPAVIGAVAPMILPVLSMGFTAPLWVVPSMIAVDIKDRYQWERTAVVVKHPDGHRVRVRVKHLWESAYYTDLRGDHLALRLAHDGGVSHYDGSTALSTGSQLLARANWLGAATGLLRRAVAQIDEIGDAEGFLHKTAYRFARFRGKRIMASYRRIGAMSLLPVERLALEMAVHEESERRALEGELARLAEEWKDAEEVAAIADGLFVDPKTERWVEDRRPQDSV